jgi:tetratricopeptide (TPR) repeat protein
MSIARRALLPTLVFAIAFVSFLPGLDGEWLNWDDDVNFLSNPDFRGLGWENLRWMATATHQGHWIPLSWLTLGVNYALGGMNPWGYHLGNLLLHAANAVLFYFTARRLLSSVARPGFGEPALSAGAAFAAVLFAVHPLRVESVVWVTERRDVLSAFFFLLSALGYLRAVERGPDGRLAPAWRGFSLAAFVCALMSKSSTLMLPAALLLLDVYPLRRLTLGWRRLLVEKLPYLALAAADALVALFAVQQGVKLTSLETHGVAGRVSIVFYSFFYYPWKLVWPVELSPMYEMPPRVNPLQPRFVVAMAVVALVTAALVALRRRWPGGLAAWAYSALMILPLSGVVHIGHQLVQDRWSYLSGMGFNLLAGGGIAWLIDARARGRVSALIARSVTAGAAAALLFLAAAAWDQTKVWQDSETLWRWSINLEPECAMCWNNLGTSLSAQKRYSESEEAFRKAFALRRGSATLASNVATALFGQEKLREAEDMLRLALSMDRNNPGALATLGTVYLRHGKYAESLPYFRQAFAQDPQFPTLVPYYSQALVACAAEERSAGRVPVAKALLQEALVVNPANAEARRQLRALAAERTGAGAASAAPRATPSPSR